MCEAPGRLRGTFALIGKGGCFTNAIWLLPLLKDLLVGPVGVPLKDLLALVMLDADLFTWALCLRLPGGCFEKSRVLFAELTEAVEADRAP